VICTPEFSPNPSSRQTSTAVLGTGVDASTSILPKSVVGGWSGTSSRLWAMGFLCRRCGVAGVAWIALLLLLLLLPVALFRSGRRVEIGIGLGY
jgi:low temperature requirement protein LtrA